MTFLKWLCKLWLRLKHLVVWDSQLQDSCWLKEHVWGIRPIIHWTTSMYQSFQPWTNTQSMSQYIDCPNRGGCQGSDSVGMSLGGSPSSGRTTLIQVTPQTRGRPRGLFFLSNNVNNFMILPVLVAFSWCTKWVKYWYCWCFKNFFSRENIFSCFNHE